MMSGHVHARILVTGRVQGVGYRAFAFDAATREGLSGGVRNLPDGRVELDVEGERPRIERLVDRLRTGPPRSRVEGVQIVWQPAADAFAGFEIWY
jgi:acylphosphatase